MNTATATMRMRSILQNAAAIAIAAAALAVTTANAQAQSFLDGKSNGMTRCVNHILNGRGTIKKVNVHGHHFNCRGMARNGNFRQINLAHAQFGKDDKYIVDFRVDSQNRLVFGIINTRIVKGFSAGTIVKLWAYTLPNYWQWLAVRKFPNFFEFDGPDRFGYEHFAQIARAVPAIENPKWETVAFEIAAITIAEHGRSPMRRPTPTIPTQTTSQLNR